MSLTLDKQVIVVSGGTRGMGEASVRGLVASGAQVVFGGRDEAAGKAIEASLGGQARFAKLDVAREQDWENIFRLAKTQFGPVTGLLNNAGLLLQKAITDVTVSELEQLMRVNQIGVLLGMKHAVPAMREAGHGSIVNIGSVGAHKGFPGISAYSGSKAALVGITLSAALELAPDRIRVNIIHPGPFETSMLKQSLAGSAVDGRVTPLNRVGQPREIAALVVYLLSDDSSFVTGAQIAMDGGQSV
jgi:3alpha(or 20beta)-hydroxysteroid dehydrogenase